MKILNSSLEMLNFVVILNTLFLYLNSINTEKKLFSFFSRFCLFEGSYARKYIHDENRFLTSFSPELLRRLLFLGEWEGLIFLLK